MKNTRQAYAEVLSTETGHGFNENHQRHYQGMEMIRCIAVERAVRTALKRQDHKDMDARPSRGTASPLVWAAMADNLVEPTAENNPQL
jgi:hypothetical protein